MVMSMTVLTVGYCDSSGSNGSGGGSSARCSDSIGARRINDRF